MEKSISRLSSTQPAFLWGKRDQAARTSSLPFLMHVNARGEDAFDREEP